MSTGASASDLPRSSPEEAPYKNSLLAGEFYFHYPRSPLMVNGDDENKIPLKVDFIFTIAEF